MRSGGRFFDVAKLFLAGRSFIFAVSIIALALLPLGDGYRTNTQSFINPWAQWDGEAYITIAEKGYVTLADGRSLYNFLPLYPLAIRMLGTLINDFGMAAFLLSNVFALIAAYFLFLLAELEFGKKVAKKTLVLLLLFPTAFFFSAVYSESLFLALAVSSFYFARKGDWTKAAAISWFLPFVRIVGLSMWIVLAAEYLSQNNKISIKHLSKKDIMLSSSILGVVLFFVYSYATTGNVLGYISQQNLWARTISSPHVALINAVELLFRGPVLAAYSLWNLSVLAFLVFTFYYSLRHMRKSYSVYMFLIMILPLLSSTLEGFSRFILVCFPSFMILAKFLDDKKKLYVPVVLLSSLLLAVLTARFVTGAAGTLFG